MGNQELIDFLTQLGKCRKSLPKHVIKTIRGQALHGDLDGAKRGLGVAMKIWEVRANEALQALGSEEGLG